MPNYTRLLKELMTHLADKAAREAGSERFAGEAASGLERRDAPKLAAKLADEPTRVSSADEVYKTRLLEDLGKEGGSSRETYTMPDDLRKDLATSLEAEGTPRLKQAVERTAGRDYQRALDANKAVRIQEMKRAGLSREQIQMLTELAESQGDLFTHGKLRKVLLRTGMEPEEIDEHVARLSGVLED